MSKDTDTESGVTLFWHRLRVTMGVMSEAFFLLLALGALAWGFDLFPAASKFFEKQLKQEALITAVEKNSEFRKCWPLGRCENIQGLPVDERQNKAIIKLGEEFVIISEYIKVDCQVNRDGGDYRFDCTRLSPPLKLEMSGG